MNKILYGIVFAAALSTAFGLILRTKGVSYAKKFQWIVENLDEMPDEIRSDYFEYDKYNSILTLRTNITCNALEIYYGPKYQEADGSRFNLHGTVTFKNSTNYTFGERLIKKNVIYNQKKHLLTVDISNIFRKHSFPELFKMLNNVLVMDFSILLTKVKSEREN